MQQAENPACKISGQEVVLALAYIMENLAPRQRLGVHPNYQANQDQIPLGTCPGNRVQQLQVHPLVDNTVKPEARVWYLLLVISFIEALCLSKVSGINATAETM